MSTSDVMDFVLPGGGLDGRGTWQREGALRALTGADEEWLAGRPASLRRPHVVTEVLRRCVRRIGHHRVTRDRIRELSVGDRDYLVVTLLRATFGETLPLVLTCPACGAKMDLDLRLEDLPITSRALQVSYLLRVEAPVPLEIEHRLPNGGDQEALAAGNVAGDDAVKHLIRRCVVAVRAPGGEALDPDGLPETATHAIAESIEEVAPRVELEMDAVCPECGDTFDVGLDPTSLLLDEIGRGRGALDRELHLLARHYHWSPRDLLALTRPRRQRFLKVLVQALEAQG